MQLIGSNKMPYEKTIFNENQLRKVIKETSKTEFENNYKKYRFELDKVWHFLNKLKEDVVILTRDLGIRKEAEREKFGINKNKSVFKE